MSCVILNGCKCFTCLLLGWLGAVTHCCCPTSQKNVLLYNPTSGKYQSLKFEICFLLNVYCFCTIISKVISGNIVSQGLSVYLVYLDHHNCLNSRLFSSTPEKPLYSLSVTSHWSFLVPNPCSQQSVSFLYGFACSGHFM